MGGLKTKELLGPTDWGRRLPFLQGGAIGGKCGQRVYGNARIRPVVRVC